jgi:hypothetical protein
MPKPAAPAVGKLLERKTGGPTKRTTIYFDPSLYLRLKGYSDGLRREMSAIVSDAVTEYLDRVAPPTRKRGR